MSYPSHVLAGGNTRHVSAAAPPLVSGVPSLGSAFTVASLPELCRDPAHAQLTPGHFPLYYVDALRWIRPRGIVLTTGVVDQEGDFIVQIPQLVVHAIQAAVPSQPAFDRHAFPFRFYVADQGQQFYFQRGQLHLATHGNVGRSLGLPLSALVTQPGVPTNATAWVGRFIMIPSDHEITGVGVTEILPF